MRFVWILLILYIVCVSTVSAYNYQISLNVSDYVNKSFQQIFNPTVTSTVNDTLFLNSTSSWLRVQPIIYFGSNTSRTLRVNITLPANLSPQNKTEFVTFFSVMNLGTGNLSFNFNLFKYVRPANLTNVSGTNFTGTSSTTNRTYLFEYLGPQQYTLQLNNTELPLNITYSFPLRSRPNSTIKLECTSHLFCPRNVSMDNNGSGWFQAKLALPSGLLGFFIEKVFLMKEINNTKRIEIAVNIYKKETVTEITIIELERCIRMHENMSLEECLVWMGNRTRFVNVTVNRTVDVPVPVITFNEDFTNKLSEAMGTKQVLESALSGYATKVDTLLSSVQSIQSTYDDLKQRVDAADSARVLNLTLESEIAAGNSISKKWLWAGLGTLLFFILMIGTYFVWQWRD